MSIAVAKADFGPNSKTMTDPTFGPYISRPIRQTQDRFNPAALTAQLDQATRKIGYAAARILSHSHNNHG